MTRTAVGQSSSSRLVWLILLATCLPGAAVRAQVSCGATLTEDVTLHEDLGCSGDGLRIVADGVTLDCAGHAIHGGGTPMSAGIRVEGAAGVSIRNCAIDGFVFAVKANNVPGLAIRGSSIRASDHGIGLQLEGADNLHIEDNAFFHNPWHLQVRDGPRAIIVGNRFEGNERNSGSVVLIRSSGARVVDNMTTKRFAVQFWDDSDDGIVADNQLGPGGKIGAGYSSRCRIERNTVGMATAGEPRTDTAVDLQGVTDCVVADNTIENIGFTGILVTGTDRASPGGPVVPWGADRNQIIRNQIRSARSGIVLFGASENTIVHNEIVDTITAMTVVRTSYGAINLRSQRNLIQDNWLSEGELGIAIIDSGENQVVQNTVSRHWVGAFDFAGPDGDGLPNFFAGNQFRANHLFGLVIFGASPDVLHNDFSANGDDEPIPEGLAALPALLGPLRGGLAFLPVNGDYETTIDDGNPANDLRAEPAIGGPGEKNSFRASRDVHIYALDSRPANTTTLAADNLFDSAGRAARVRQDWRGLIQVEGIDETMAEVRVYDKTGHEVSRSHSGTDGIAPEERDATRPHGLSPFEPNGPLPAWPRFTEYVVDASGRRDDRTPHTISVLAPDGTGRAHYSWDGLPNDVGGQQAQDGRYQIARVQLGTGCSTLDDLRSTLDDAESLSTGYRQSLLARIAAAERTAPRGTFCALLGGLAEVAGIDGLDAANLAACIREVSYTMGMSLPCDKDRARGRAAGADS